ncbi:M48 family metallopeptidase [Patescibacteria group bacterium]|nr:M48 family metallopeptidase [Patescibacteria group bacterium]
MKTDLYSQIDANKQKTYLIVFLFIAIIVSLVYVLSRVFLSEADMYFFVPLSILFSTGSAVSSFFWGDKMVLAISGAKKSEGSEFFEYNKLTENISIVAGIKTPNTYYIIDSAPNAFATGRDPNHASVCVTTGLLQKLNRAELEGVIAHEIAHIKNFDTRLMVIVSILAGFVAIIADYALRHMFYSKSNDDDRKSVPPFLLIFGIVLIIFAPIAAELIKLAISRNREYLADATGTYFTRYPKGLADALQKISSDKEPLEMANSGTAHLYISDPFKKRLFSFLSTHPPIEERVKRLNEM